MKVWVPCIFIWVLMWAITYTGMCADLDYLAEYSWRSSSDARAARNHTVFCAFMALLPPMWIVGPAASHLYQHGFRWSVRPSSMNGGPRR